jgi:hypothetical protein
MLDSLGNANDAAPVTVDPSGIRRRYEGLLTQHYPRFTGLTGSLEAIDPQEAISGVR